MTAQRSTRAQAPSRPRSSSPARSRGSSTRTPASLQSFAANPAVIALGGLALLGLLVWTYYPVARVQYIETRTKVKLESELASLKASNEELARDVERLKTPEGVEDQAREQLGLVKPGEHPVVVLGQESADETAAPKAEAEEAPPELAGPWTDFLDAVFRVKD